MVKPQRTSRGWTVATVAWLVCVAAGLAVLHQYSYRAGEADAAPDRWPVDTSLAFADQRPNLVMFLHPKCPCSRASLREFEEIVARFHDSLHGRVVFVRPAGVPDQWLETDLRRSALAIPGVETAIDDGGRAAERFGARTSGHAFLFDARKELVFSGGITASRGHEGDNAGRGAIVAFLRDQRRGSPTPCPVFGCPLLDPSDS